MVREPTEIEIVAAQASYAATDQIFFEAGVIDKMTPWDQQEQRTRDLHVVASRAVIRSMIGKITPAMIDAWANASPSAVVGFTDATCASTDWDSLLNAASPPIIDK